VDRLEAMSLLLTVVENGSLSAAGRKLGVPLATVSRKIADLEAHLRTRLLTRTTRHLALTDAGRSYVAACRRILDQVEEAERVASGEYSAPRGDLFVTAPIVFGRLHLLPVAVDFLKAYPAINLRLMLADRVLDMMEDQVDVALRIGALKDSSMKALRVGEIRRVVVASPAYLAERGRPSRPLELESHCRVVFSDLFDQASWIFQNVGAPEIVSFQPRLIVNTAEAALDAAVSGFGVTRVLSYQAAAAAQSGALEILLKDFEPPPIPVSLVYADQRLIPLKLRAFLDYAAPRLRAALA
jgi:DNA-binding transcriptional LysR family regulator